MVTRRLGVDADHAALQVVGAVLHEPRDAAGDDQLGHADHRPARPRARACGTSLLTLVWVILAYMIASTVLVLTAGRLSDLFGRKQAYVARLRRLRRSPRWAPASPPTARELILWRIVQGVGGAFLFANASALVTDAFPREQLGVAMGTNTMVAAVGLVLGPVLGGALVAISWHWVFWFNVPLGARRRACGPRSSCASWPSPTSVRGLDLLGHASTFVVGLTGLVLGISRGRPRRLERPASSSAGLVAAVVLLPLFVVDRAPRPRADARPDDLPEPPVRGRHRRRVHQRPLALRADVRVRLLLPGRAGRRPDHGRASSSRRWRSGCSISSPLAGIWADRHGSRALAALRDARQRASAWPAMTTLQPDTPYWQSRAVAADRRHRLGHVQLAQHRGDDGHGRRRTAAASRPARGRCCRTPARSSRSPSCWRSSPPRCRKDVLFKIFSGAGQRALRTPSSTRSSTTCTRRCGCWRRPRWSARASRCCGRATAPVPRRAEASRRPPTEPRAAHRRGRRAGGHDAAHDPLLRGDRAAARRRRPREPARTAPTPRTTSSACGSCCASRTLLGLSLDELKRARRGRGAARRAAARSSTAAASDPAAPRDPRRRRCRYVERQLELVAPPARGARRPGGRAGRAPGAPGGDHRGGRLSRHAPPRLARAWLRGRDAAAVLGALSAR